MTNKLVPVGIVRTCSRFDGKSRIEWVWRCTYPRHNTRPRYISVPV